MLLLDGKHCITRSTSPQKNNDYTARASEKRVQKEHSENSSEHTAFVRIGEDFAGLGTGAIALERIVGEECTNFVFASEVDEQTRAVLMANLGIQHVLGDPRKRDNSKMKFVKIYLWGAPCIAYAPGGKHEGEASENGKLIFEGINYVQAKRPSVFVCEGSHTLTGTISCTLEKLRNLALDVRDSNRKHVYHVDYKTMRSKTNEVPQDRVRMYLVGWQKKFSPRLPKFDWPEDLPMPAVEGLVNPLLPSQAPFDSVAVDNLMLPLIAKDGVNLRRVSASVDRYQSASFGNHWSFDICPTITRARAGVGSFS